MLTTLPATTTAPVSTSWANVCYFTNWARYRKGLINKDKDIFEMGLDANLCTHFMYGFGKVSPNAANGATSLRALTRMLTIQVATHNRTSSAPMHVMTPTSNPTGMTQMAFVATGLAAPPASFVVLKV